MSEKRTVQTDDEPTAHISCPHSLLSELKLYPVASRVLRVHVRNKSAGCLSSAACDAGRRDHEHTQLWKKHDAKNEKYLYGVQVANAWYWYESWLSEVEKHCKENKDKYE